MKCKLKSGHTRLKTKLGLPDLELAKVAVIVSLRSVVAGAWNANFPISTGAVSSSTAVPSRSLIRRAWPLSTPVRFCGAVQTERPDCRILFTLKVATA